MFSEGMILNCIYALPCTPNNKQGCLEIIIIWLFTEKLKHWKAESFQSTGFWIQSHLLMTCGTASNSRALYHSLYMSSIETNVF